MTESEIIAKNLREQCAEFLTDPTLLVELEEYYSIPGHISENQYNEWLSLHSKGKVCHFMKDQWPIYHPKIACLLENNSAIANKFKAAYLAGYAQGMSYCIEDLEIREEQFLKNYNRSYLESIMYFYNQKEVDINGVVQKGSVYVKSYCSSKGMPELLYQYGFHSCVVWYVENLIEKFPDKFKLVKKKKTRNKEVVRFSEMFIADGKRIETELRRIHFTNGVHKKDKMFWTEFLCVCFERNKLRHLENKEYVHLINSTFDQDYKENNATTFSKFRKDMWAYKGLYDFSFV